MKKLQFYLITTLSFLVVITIMVATVMTISQDGHITVMVVLTSFMFIPVLAVLISLFMAQYDILFPNDKNNKHI